MSAEEKQAFTDDTPLSELTVGQFKQLIADLLQANTSTTETTENETIDGTEVTVRRKSLDEFMSDLTDKS